MIIMQETDIGPAQGRLKGSNHLGLGHAKPCRPIPVHHHFPLACGRLQRRIDIHQAIHPGHALGHLPGQCRPSVFIHRIDLRDHG